MQNKLTKIFYNFSRKIKRQIDPETMKNIQQIKFEKALKKYPFPEEFKHQDLLFQEELYGNKCEISGITENNYRSAEFTKQVLQVSRPKLVILGGLNDTQAMYLLDQPTKTFLNIENLQTAKLYCKSTLLPTLQQRIEESPNYFYNKKDKLIWKHDNLNRCLIVNDYFNTVYESGFNDIKLIYGKPSSIFIYEDLMLQLSLEELKQIFSNTLKSIKKNHQFSTDHSSVVMMTHLKTYSMRQNSKLYSKQLTYTTALLNRLTKVDSRNLLLIPTCFVKQISQNVHNVDFEPQNVYRKWLNDEDSENYHKLVKNIVDQKIQELLEKFAILSILKGFHLEAQLHHGKNFFKNSIFMQLFEKYTAKQILAMYTPYKHKYINQLLNIQRQRVKNKISHHKPQTLFMTMKHQFQTIQKRKQMFLYEFQPKNFITQKENAIKTAKLSQKLKEILELQCDEYERQLMEQYSRGIRTKQNIILYSKLIGKANVELDEKLKLPYYHFNAFRGFYKQYYRQHLLFDEQKRKNRLQMKKIRKIQDNFNKIAKQINDPKVLTSYLRGEKGPVKELNLIENQSGQIDIDGELEDLQNVVKELGGSQEMLQEISQFRKKQRQEFGDEWDDDQIQQGGQLSEDDDD